MHIQFPADSSFETFLQTIKDLPGEYMLLFLTFAGCYSSLLSKQRFVQTALAETLPLVEIDTRNSPLIYEQLKQTMPNIVLNNKLPVHLFCRIGYIQESKKLQITPLLRNFTTLGDVHFHQITKLLE